jgi:aspartyl-tRNA synthetase
MEEQERILVYGMQKIKDEYEKEIKEFFGKEIVVPKIPFPKVSIKEAKQILSKRKVKGEKEGDLSTEEEKAIGEYIKEKFNHEFVFVTEYPFSARPFYHMKEEKDSSLTKSSDLIWNGLEISTCAQREHRYDILVAQAKEKKMDTRQLQFYLNFFKYGCPPHGGFGMGANRMIMKLLGFENVRDAMFIYRGVKRLTP